jgi:23S rRNA (cytosine1962-C5)-methyltransferase
MRNAKGIVLKPGKDKAVRNRHHWIFSGAVANLPADLADGGIAPVLSDGGELLGHAYVNRNCSILGRVVSFGPGDPFAALEKNILSAIALRKDLFGEGEKTNAFRLVNAEGDGIPGLVVDRYDSVLVLQVATLGMEKLKDFVLETLVRELAPETVYEKSNLPSRREEGLGDRERSGAWSSSARTASNSSSTLSVRRRPVSTSTRGRCESSSGPSPGAGAS